MSTRPTTPLPTWSTAGSNVEPSAGKKSAGWTVNERPPAEWLNWLQNSAGAWLQFLADVTSASATTDLRLNFANTDMFAPLIDVTTEPPAGGYRLLQRVRPNSTQHVNIYAGNTVRRLVFTFNATWGGSSWICEDSSQGASGIAVLGDGLQNTLELLYHAPTASPWADNAWARGNALVNAFTAASGTFTDLTVTNDLSVGRDAHVTRDATVGRNLTVTDQITTEDLVVHDITSPAVNVTFHSHTHFDGDIGVHGALVALDPDVDIVYPGPVASQPFRKILLDLSRGKGWDGWGTPLFDGDSGRWHATPAGSPTRIQFALPIPRGTLRIGIEVVWECAVLAANNRFAIYRTVRDFIGGGTLMPVPADPEQISTTVFQGIATPSGGCVMDSQIFDYAFDPSVDAYSLVVELLDGTANNLYAVRFAFADPGARNG